MKFLIDTCCISELMKTNPNRNVIQWFEEANESDLFLSVITFGELQKEISKLPDSTRKSTLTKWVDEDLRFRFNGQILEIDLIVTIQWGEILASCEIIGKPMSTIDALTAATASVHGLTIVTRNTSDFQHSGLKTVNPWTHKLGTI
jgi:toxin FitB